MQLVHTTEGLGEVDYSVLGTAAEKTGNRNTTRFRFFSDVIRILLEVRIKDGIWIDPDLLIRMRKAC